MSASSFAHRSVLLNESIDALNINPDGIYIDATFGRGGHSAAILNKLNSQGRLIAFDRDPAAIASAQQFAADARFQIIHQPFADIADVIDQLDLAGQVNGVLMDLGVSSPQLDDASRGFSFMREGPLDMRMDTTRGFSAAEWLANADEQDITQVIKEFGEEKFGKRIAHAIVAERQHTPLTTTKQLADLIDKAVPVKDKFKHPATRSFQGIRIYVNSELEQLRDGLKAAVYALASEGRLAVISFHSLEDRLVKRFMREQSKGKDVPHGMPIPQAEIDADKVLRLIGKAIKPGHAELEDNNRARSSVLRVAEKL
ncbi:16S rRNA (cytosine(1402)-N(4))-methyltransferase RsmH [Alteromonas oceanisediminis]|uniref:16S rRNA (cytosine(1402)-N(4))-methyltransferase RsmH n=1 Tax=Alteromonas oceanisediminis TaxID=2836180 RepID=UPI001BD95A72|nr:16S rRNA (cytosine(1402)-N(4))-methyltransferase RsmH [Alteromonas oceanisediminis]MBT0585517.1 16S rRNA (cytosine(1402)-N(4))-methyltransferase RsmH [Alteromonas oceanisediminis]